MIVICPYFQFELHSLPLCTIQSRDYKFKKTLTIRFNKIKKETETQLNLNVKSKSTINRIREMETHPLVAIKKNKITEKSTRHPRISASNRREKKHVYISSNKCFYCYYLNHIEMVYSLRWLLSRGDQHVKHTSMHQNFGKTTVLKSSGITLCSWPTQHLKLKFI